MRAVRVARNRGINISPTRGERGQKRRRYERHVAGNHQHLFGRRLDERRVESPQRAGSGNAILHDLHVGFLVCPWRRRVMPDDQDVRSKATQHRKLAFENRAGADTERALVASAESPRLPPGKDRCRPHQFAVSSRQWAVGSGASHPRTRPIGRRVPAAGVRLPTAVTLSENVAND